MKHVSLPMNDRLRDFLWEKHIIPKPWQRKSLADVKTLLVPPGLAVEPMTRHVFRRPEQALVLSSAKHMTYLHSALPRTRLGAYCSVALGVIEMGDTHPTERVSTHLYSYEPYYQHLSGLAPQDYRAHAEFRSIPPDVIVGNDVWIGADVVLKGGITIGDGAVIAARAVVTRDVEPYAVMGGMPAKLIRHRFPAELRARLLATKWWDYRLRDVASFPSEDPAAFCDAFEAARPGLTPRRAQVITVQTLQALV